MSGDDFLDQLRDARARLIRHRNRLQNCRFVVGDNPNDPGNLNAMRQADILQGAINSVNFAMKSYKKLENR
jgi:hypothetical protein